MYDQELVNLNNNNYNDVTKNLYVELFLTGKYSDVTLISDDQTQFKAHKFVLNYQSSFFHNIFKHDVFNLQNTVILSGIHKLEVESILQFMYLGKTTFEEERINVFLQTAKALNVTEIVENLDPQEKLNISDKVALTFHEGLKDRHKNRR